MRAILELSDALMKDSEVQKLEEKIKSYEWVK